MPRDVQRTLDALAADTTALTHLVRFLFVAIIRQNRPDDAVAAFAEFSKEMIENAQAATAPGVDAALADHTSQSIEESLSLILALIQSDLAEADKRSRDQK